MLTRELRLPRAFPHERTQARPPNPSSKRQRALAAAEEKRSKKKSSTGDAAESDARVEAEWALQRLTARAGVPPSAVTEPSVGPGRLDDSEAEPFEEEGDDQGWDPLVEEGCLEKLAESIQKLIF